MDRLARQVVERHLAQQQRLEPASDPVVNRVVQAHLRATGMTRTAGEVRFVKDTGADWAFSTHGPETRHLGDFQYNQKKIKVLARILRGTMIGLGHLMSSYSHFAKLKSSEISPDGSLGGKGYIQTIRDMRKLYMNCVEAMSAISDTLYDEIKAPHWAPIMRANPEAQEIVNETEEIKKDPEDWAEKEEKKEFGE